MTRSQGVRTVNKRVWYCGVSRTIYLGEQGRLTILKFLPLLFAFLYEVFLFCSACASFSCNTVKLRAETRVTIQKIKSLGVLQFEFYVAKGGATNRDMSLTETCFCSRLYGK